MATYEIASTTDCDMAFYGWVCFVKGEGRLRAEQ